MKIAFTCGLLFLSLPAEVLGCSCRRFSMCARLESPDVKPFIGEVVAGGIDSLRLDPWYSPVTQVRFKVLESFGVDVPRPEFRMSVAQTDGMCSPMPYIHGRRYLVFPKTIHDGEEGVCGFTGLPVDEFPDEVRQVRDLYAGRDRQRLLSYAAAAGRFEVIQVRLEMRKGGPPTRIRVTATRGEKTYSAPVDAGGRSELIVSGKGAYRIDVSGEGYQAEPSIIEIPAQGCTIQDIALATGNLIEGQLRDPGGKPLSRASVTLLDADPTHPGLRPFLRTAHANGAGGFSFKNVDPGRYLLRYEPERPSDTSPNWDSAYYPFSSTRDLAKVIEIKGSGNHVKGLVIVPGPPIAYRTLAVRVRFPDGQPMTTAEVRVTGDDWEDRVFIGSQSKDGWGKALVPTNRKLRVTVTDSWKRDLKREYVAEFPPGTAALEKEFVIEP